MLRGLAPAADNHHRPILLRSLATDVIVKPRQRSSAVKPSPLQKVPLPALLRSLLVLTAAALPSRAVSILARTVRKHINTIESIKPLRSVINRTFYKHFCVGATKTQIAASVAELRSLGITGVVLAFAREAKDGSSFSGKLSRDDFALQEWTKMNLETLDQLQDGDFIALRLSGAGAAASKFMEDFTQTQSATAEGGMTNELDESLREFQNRLQQVCLAARKRHVRVLIDAEGSSLQPAIDFMALDLMRKFNTQGSALIYNTYQTYLKSSLPKIKTHLSHAAANKYHLGLKLVRGAYIHVEPRRHLIHDSKAETDRSFDDAVQYLLKQRTPIATQTKVASAQVSESVSGSGPWTADVMLATHNTQSVMRALVDFEEAQKNSPNSADVHPAVYARTHGVQRLLFAQLMGMADEVSMDLVERTARNRPTDKLSLPTLGVYKYSVWGSMSECLLYMLRRAEENRDAAARSRETASAILRELVRRLGFH